MPRQRVNEIADVSTCANSGYTRLGYGDLKTCSNRSSVISTWEPKVTIGSQRLDGSKLEKAYATSGRTCWFAKVRTHNSSCCCCVLFTKPVTERFVLLNGPVPECLRLVHGKELPVPKGWNSRLPTWEPQVTIAKNFWLPEVGTHPSNLVAMGYHCKELLVLKVGTDRS